MKVDLDRTGSFHGKIVLFGADQAAQEDREEGYDQRSSFQPLPPCASEQNEDAEQGEQMLEKEKEKEMEEMERGASQPVSEAYDEEFENDDEKQEDDVKEEKEEQPVEDDGRERVTIAQCFAGDLLSSLRSDDESQPFATRIREDNAENANDESQLRKKDDGREEGRGDGNRRPVDIPEDRGQSPEP
eukprot:131014-Rhodomonas_salina.1